MNKLTDLVKPKVLLVSFDTHIDVALKSMIKQRVSSALIFDASDDVVGILTERDILRKIATLDIDRKLEYTVGTIMSRPVRFACIDTIDADVRKLHQEFSLRHFPVLKKKGDANKANIAGIITVTDLARLYLGSGT